MRENVRVYKSATHFKSQDDALHRISIFNYEQPWDESYQPFGNLIAFNNEMLEPKHKIFRHVEQATEIVIVPLAGAVLYTDSLGNEDIVETEQIRVFSADEGMTYTLENPYAEDLINYLQIWITPNGNEPAQSHQQKFSYPGKNVLFPIFSGDKKHASIGVRQDATGFLAIFRARDTADYEVAKPGNGLFAVNGTFDFESHRIEKNDAVALCGINRVRMEAITENALVLLIDIAL